MASGFQRISHRAQRVEAGQDPKLWVMQPIVLANEDEICRSLRGKLIWSRGDR